MPELPEARTIAGRLHAAISGATLAEVRLRRRDMLKTGRTRDLEGLAGQVILRVDTRGKYIVLHTLAARLVIQLGMSGRVLLLEPDPPAVPMHTHLLLRLADQRQVLYVNTRRIASGLHVLPPGREDLGPLAALGPEATAISAGQFIAAMRPRRRAIKTALLDQSLLAGVGNIYSDEALARAGIRPTRAACGLSAERLRRLHAGLQAVLREALRAGGSSLADANPYVDADGRLGEFAASHRVYGRYGQPCLTCGGTLKRAMLGGRTSTYCSR